MTKRLRWGLAAAVLLGLALLGLATVPHSFPRMPSTALPATDRSELDQLALTWEASAGEASGFAPLAGGMDALGARLRLIEKAGTSIDVQYFIIKSDMAGQLFLGKLLRAADRGVRVRLLVDDIWSSVADSELGLLNTHPNIEVRLYNPVSRWGLRVINMISDFNRINRRMHNKVLIADNRFAVFGGRNIGDEYFELDGVADFADLDVLSVGPVVPELSEAFDLFWNDKGAVPMDAFQPWRDLEDLEERRARIDAKVQEGSQGVYSTAVSTPLLQNGLTGLRLFSGLGSVVVDSPDKLRQAPTVAESYALQSLQLRLSAAVDQAVLVTPYLVPGDEGVAFFSGLTERGVDLKIVTNSLAATNHPIVHAGYIRYRHDLLRAGVRLFEVRPDGVGRNEVREGTSMTMHTKGVLIDDYTVIAGSLNLDPRSFRYNTEMAVIMDSPGAAAYIDADIVQSLPSVAWEVRLAPDDSLVWVAQDQEFDQEPGTDWWRRLQVQIGRLIPERML